jgi:probable F420-dependent oxidoreductase
MDVDVMVGPHRLREHAEIARHTLAAGFSGLTFTETGRTAYLGATAAALAAPGLTLSTGIAVAFPRSPMITASTAWELADETEGRFLLGLGTQVKAHIERRFSTDFDPPGPRLREYILAVKAIFRAFNGDEPLKFEGEYYRFSLLPAQWTPGPIAHPHVPVYISAVNPWMLQMAGEVADGIHVHPLHSQRYLEQVLLPTVAKGTEGAGRTEQDVSLAVPVFTVVGDTEEEKERWRAMARQQIAFYGSTRAYAFQFDLVGFDGLSARLNERMKAGDLPGMAALITDEVLAEFTVEAGWDSLSDRLVDRYGSLADRLILYFGDAMRAHDAASYDRLGEVAADVRSRST